MGHRPGGGRVEPVVALVAALAENSETGAESDGRRYKAPSMEGPKGSTNRSRRPFDERGRASARRVLHLHLIDGRPYETTVEPPSSAWRVQVCSDATLVVFPLSAGSPGRPRGRGRASRRLGGPIVSLIPGRSGGFSLRRETKSLRHTFSSPPPVEARKMENSVQAPKAGTRPELPRRPGLRREAGVALSSAPSAAPVKVRPG